MSSRKPPVVFEIWSEDAAERTGPSGAGPGPPRRPASPVALVVAAIVGAVLASGGFASAAAILSGAHDAHDAALVRQEVAAAVADLVRTQGLVPARFPVAPVPAVSSDPRAPCSPVRVERLGHC